MSVRRSVTVLSVAVVLLAVAAVVAPGTFAALEDRDAMITKNVMERLAQEPGIQREALEVATLNGRVILRGYVDSTRTADKTIEIVKNIDGVRSVQNNLVVWEDGYPGALPQARGFQSP